MASTLTKFNNFVANLGLAALNLNTDSLLVLLTNTVPNVADTVVDTTTTPCTVKATSNASEIAAGNGYTKGGAAIGSNAYSLTGGVATLAGNAVVFTATGAVGPFRYAVLYDNTGGTTATRPVIGWWDYGSSVSLSSGQTLTIGNGSTGGNWTSANYAIQVQ